MTKDVTEEAKQNLQQWMDEEMSLLSATDLEAFKTNQDADMKKHGVIAEVDSWIRLKDEEGSNRPKGRIWGWDVSNPAVDGERLYLINWPCDDKNLWNSIESTVKKSKVLGLSNFKIHEASDMDVEFFGMDEDNPKPVIHITKNTKVIPMAKPTS